MKFPTSSVLFAGVAMSMAVLSQIVTAQKKQTSAAAKKSNAKNGGQQPPNGLKSKALKLGDYRRWKCANPEPFWVPERTAAMCAAPPMGIQSSPGPHEGKFIRVFVNPIARDAMLKMKTPKFARGSVIVKEKLATARSRKAELLTVMVKREAGFDASNGDWEYLVVNGSGTKVEQRGKLGNCQGCHKPQKETDYIFRTYLPAAIERDLR